MGKRKDWQKERKDRCSKIARILRDRYDFDIGPKRQSPKFLKDLVANGFVVIDDLDLNGRQSTEALRQVLAKMENFYKLPIEIQSRTIPLKIGEKDEVKERHLSFYDTAEWIILRGKVLIEHGRKCMRCQSEKDIQVDHVLPRSKFPNLELEFSNMQVLCKSCNLWKSNTKYTDFRQQETQC